MKYLKPLLTAALCWFCLHATMQQAEAQEEKPVSMEIYGFTMTDIGYNFKRIDPLWFDVMRPTKLPAFTDEFGDNGETYFSVRQTRFGVKNNFPTALGELKTIFEWELFGTGVDAGQTTFRLRHAYGELGKFGAGQYWSPFMDIDVFPNSLEYWGPCGMVFFRNVQFRYMPIQGDTRLTFALERPGASADQGIYGERIELDGIRGRFPLPDLTAEYRYGGKSWGYVELAGLLRSIKWDDVRPDQFDLSGSEVGWGLNLSSNINFFKKDKLKLEVVYGQGMENYMNDAPADIGIDNDFENTTTPIKGKALPVLGIVAFYDRYWNDRFSSSIGYSLTDIDNSEAQDPSAFNNGQYALANLLWYPTTNVMMGTEFQWGNRSNFSDGWDFSDYKLQFSFRYNFSQKFYRDQQAPQ